MAESQQQVLSSPSGARKRKCDPASWLSNVAKKHSNLRQQYISKKTKETVAGREVGLPCQCTMKCFTVIGEEANAVLHREFWASGDHNIQTAFIQSCAIKKPVARHYTTSVAKRQDCRRTYQVHVNGNNIPVCLG